MSLLCLGLLDEGLRICISEHTMLHVSALWPPTSLAGSAGVLVYEHRRGRSDLQASGCVHNDSVIVLSPGLCQPLPGNLCRLGIHPHLKDRHLHQPSVNYQHPYVL